MIHETYGNMRFMTGLRRALIGRLMLVILLATFLSPVTGWAMVADHDQLEHSVVVQHADDDDHDADHHAHSWFGHLLSHLPVVFAVAGWQLPPQTGTAALATNAASAPHFLADPPYKPPLA